MCFAISDVGIDGKSINTGISNVVVCRSPIDGRCGVGGIEQLLWRADATLNNSNAATSATQSELGIEA